MVILSLMILIIAIALKPYTNNAGNSLIVTESGSSSLNDSGSGISPILLTRITSIVFLFSGALSYNALYIQSIGSGLSIYSGLFQITALSQSFDIVLFLLGSLILLPWSRLFNVSYIRCIITLLFIFFISFFFNYVNLHISCVGIGVLSTAGYLITTNNMKSSGIPNPSGATALAVFSLLVAAADVVQRSISTIKTAETSAKELSQAETQKLLTQTNLELAQNNTELIRANTELTEKHNLLKQEYNSLNINYKDAQELAENIYKKGAEIKNQVKDASTRANIESPENEAIRDSLEKLDTNISDMLRVVQELIAKNPFGKGSGSSSSSILETISSVSGQYSEYLSGLPFYKVYALLHILFIVSSFLLLWNIFILVYSDHLIQYYDISQRFPRLGRVIKIRRSLIKYNAYLYVFILLLIYLLLLFVNVIVFFTLN